MNIRTKQDKEKPLIFVQIQEKVEACLPHKEGKTKKKKIPRFSFQGSISKKVHFVISLSNLQINDWGHEHYAHCYSQFRHPMKQWQTGLTARLTVEI